MKRILLVFVFLVFVFIGKSQVYQAMPQYGYGPVKRMDLDSSLTIPTTCGTPTLRTYINNKCALAFDSCNNVFYIYNPKPKTWSQFNASVAIDTSNKFVNAVTSINDSTIRVFKGSTSNDLLIRGTGGGGTTPDLQAVTDEGATTTNTIELSQLSGFFTTKLNLLEPNQSPVKYYPFFYTSIFEDTFYIRTLNEGENQNIKIHYNYPNAPYETLDITADSIFMQTSGTGVLKLVKQLSTNQTAYFPNTNNGVDTIATLSDVRNYDIGYKETVLVVTFDNANQPILDAVVKNDFSGYTPTITLTGTGTLTIKLFDVNNIEYNYNDLNKVVVEVDNYKDATDYHHGVYRMDLSSINVLIFQTIRMNGSIRNTDGTTHITIREYN